jgi:hypothetical protein
MGICHITIEGGAKGANKESALNGISTKTKRLGKDSRLKHWAPKGSSLAKKYGDQRIGTPFIIASRSIWLRKSTVASQFH